jgi:MFS family permease
MYQSSNSILGNKYLLIALLYVSQSIPFSFIRIGLPAILKNTNVDLKSIGAIIALMIIPWVLKFIWAPYLDKFKKRLPVIIIFQIIGFLLVYSIAFLQIDLHLQYILWLFVFFSFVAASQDIAIDGFTYENLEKQNRGWGNTLQLGGYYAGQLIGGSLILLLHDIAGWKIAILSMGIFWIIPFIPLFFSKETPREIGNYTPNFSVIAHFFRIKNTFWRILLILTFTSGQTLCYSMVSPMLIDFGFSQREIAFLIGIVGFLASILGATIAGFFLRYYQINVIIVAFSIIQLFFNLVFIIPFVWMNPNFTMMLICILVLQLGGGLAGTSLYTEMMNACRKTSPGSDFTLQQSLHFAGISIFTTISGILAKNLGYLHLMSIGFFVGFLALFVVLKYVQKNTKPTTTYNL